MQIIGLFRSGFIHILLHDMRKNNFDKKLKAK